MDIINTAQWADEVEQTDTAAADMVALLRELNDLLDQRTGK